MTEKINDNAKLRDEKSIENARVEIAKGIQPGNDPQVRQYAAMLLGQFSEPEGIGPLLYAIRDPDKKVRARAAEALGMIGDPSVDSLVLLMDDPDWKIRYRAAEALGITGSKKGVPSLITALDDPKDHVRYMAAKAIGATRSGTAEVALIARLGDENEFVRKSAATALGKTGNVAAKEAITHSLGREPSEEVRKAFGAALQLLETQGV